MDELPGWTHTQHTAPDTQGRRVTHSVFRKGSGPAVVIVAEVPGITPAVLEFADDVVNAGFTVALPHLFGTPGAAATMPRAMGVVARACVSREFTVLATGQTSPVAGWLRSLCRALHEELGGPGVGALGMCLTGGFALAMMVDPSVVAPVLAQPSLPFCVGRRRAADLGLSPEDLAVVKQRTAAGQPVLGLRFVGDPAVGPLRFDTLRRELGDAFIAVEFPGKQHSTLTEHRQEEGVERVLAFFNQQLHRA